MLLEFSPQNLDEITSLLHRSKCTGAIIKPLQKNHNDKNQVYVGSDFRPLYPFFEFRFAERIASVSAKQNGKHEGVPILEAVFEDFCWLGTEGQEVPARNLKMIIYPQYPEARLSGFVAVDGNMPFSMSVDFTKKHPDTKRYLLLARRGLGSAIGVMITGPGPQFVTEVEGLPATRNSRIWKHIELGVDARKELHSLLSYAAGKEHPGSRLDREGNSIPFNGTQVCGFTLEHALGIIPNSDKDGDFKGIELKTHTQKKVTLFTPEPDLGIYNQNFREFMTRFGYRDSNENYRLTGIHRANTRCDKSGLTLRIANYDSTRRLVTQTDRDITIGLYSDDGTLAAGWSLSRILNCWGAKHNETVYVPAEKISNTRQDLLDAGYKYLVRFSRHVRWCRGTSADRLFRAIEKGTIFLDPAPKYVPSSPSASKRRSQWRVNDIGQAVYELYESVEEITLDGPGFP